MQPSTLSVFVSRRAHASSPLIAAVVLLVLLLVLMRIEHLAHIQEAITMELTGPEVVLRHRETFRNAVSALARSDAVNAILALESFSFGKRATEPYRLYLLANAYSLAGDTARARLALEKAWRQNRKMVGSTDIAFHLLDLYGQRNEWDRAALLTAELIEADENDLVGATGRREHLIASFYAGNPGAMSRTALQLAIHDVDASAAEGSIDLVIALRDREEGRGLDPAERLDRVEQLVAKRKPVDALSLADRIDTEALSPTQQKRLLLARGQAMSRLGRYKESEETLEPLFSDRYRYAIPALETSARNRRILSEVAIPRNISKKGLWKREAEINEHRKIYLERLHDLLSLPIGTELKVIVLERLIDDAEKNEELERMKRLISVLAIVDPSTDRGLQILWDQGWLAYEKQNDPIAIDRFDFIVQTYRNPSVRRQARYWLAKSLARVGRTERANEIFRLLADSSYEDLYTQFARARLRIPLKPSSPQPLPVSTAEDWAVTAERDMPRELRLAWELTLLGEFSEAREEVRRHRTEANAHFADALFGETFHAVGAWQIGNRYLKRAFPTIATAEQSDVPLHFLKMYYVLPYEDEILRCSRARNIDPSLVAALIHQETTFDATAVSPAGARGLMQLMPGTAREISEKLTGDYQETRLFDPAFNIQLGTYYIDQVLEMMKGDIELAAAGYNGGPYRVRRWRQATGKPKDEFIEGIPLSETRNYVKRVTILRSSYRTLYPSLRISA